MSGKTFHCKRGLRQWDPLSPLLFVLAADLLQTVINNAKDQGRLKLPIITGASNDFPVIQYAHDTLVIMEACPTQLTVLKDLLNTFAQSTWLKVNYSKSVMVPLNISDGNLDQHANLFNCQKGTLPFTYLGLPLGTTKPNIYWGLSTTHSKNRKMANIHLFHSIPRGKARNGQYSPLLLSSLPNLFSKAS